MALPLLAACGQSADQPSASTTHRTTHPSSRHTTRSGSPTPSPTHSTRRASAPRPTTSTSVPPVPSATAASGPRAVDALAALPVRPAGPATGYSREQFGIAYSDHIDPSIPSGRNGCDQRNDIRRRDGKDVVIKRGSKGCVVSSARFADPYTGTTITMRASGFEHVVALKDAWISGAASLDPARRADIAGDPLNLLIVDGRTNMSKGDKSAAAWLPPNVAFRCAYVARQIAVKSQYGLSVTQAEHDKMASVLAGCPATKVPTEADVAPPEPATR